MESRPGYRYRRAAAALVRYATQHAALPADLHTDLIGWPASMKGRH
ncbi:hypothetical protein P4H71_28125 [Paenibacillus kribbensis]|nr:hypothetical protein [Paenibacillus kribbensis]MEC0238185.1 hypothetical protein [Paenibacillus kribbensis]